MTDRASLPPAQDLGPEPASTRVGEARGRGRGPPENLDARLPGAALAGRPTRVPVG